MKTSSAKLPSAMVITVLLGSGVAVAKPVVAPKKAPACLGLSPDGACKPATPEPTTKNVGGTELAVCSTAPMTGYFRDGRCHTGPTDRGVHVVCAQMTEAFLKFTKRQGNDLSTPAPQYGFVGLKPGDRWCLCASRWKEAHAAKTAPPVILNATHAKAANIVALEALRSAALKPTAAPSSR